MEIAGTAEVIRFFDRLAPTWDANLDPKDALITKILDNAAIGAGLHVLDVACGTGVLFPHYLLRGVASVTGIDISPGMAGIAKEKYAAQPGIRVICGDVETVDFGRRFDRVVVYNAFPHFQDPKRLIKRLASLTGAGGRLTVAHSMSREEINSHHQGQASRVSMGLMEAEELKALFTPYFQVDVLISNQEMYQVSGILK